MNNICFFNKTNSLIVVEQLFSGPRTLQALQKTSSHMAGATHYRENIERVFAAFKTKA
jgi:hypothetical protein